MKELVLGFFALVIITLLLWLITGPIAFIGPGERGVEVQQGKVTGKVYTEGWNVYNSLTKDIIQYDIRSQVSTETAAAASQDLQDVKAEIAVQYHLDSGAVAHLLETVGRQEDVVEKIINPAVQETVKASTARFPVEDIIKERPRVKDLIQKSLNERLKKYGVIVEEVSIKNINFSPEFTNAIEKRQVAEQNKQKAQFEADARIIQAEAKAREQELLQSTLSDGVLQRLAIEKWNGIMPHAIGGDGTLFNIPIGN